MSVLDENNGNLTFHSEAEVKAFSKFFLNAHPFDSQCEFSSEDEFKEFLMVRERNLQVQLDFFRHINFERPNTTRIQDKYYKIAAKRHLNPLSSEGSFRKSSRFNYKDEDQLRNKVVYFGKSEACCELEKFHLDYQVELSNQAASGAPKDELDIQFAPQEENLVYEYNVDIDKILVLTSKPSCDAINIRLGSYRNEWFELNDMYEIPSASQVLGAIVKAKKYNGIMYTSVRHQASPNLVIFEENTGKLEFKTISEKRFTRLINRV